MSDNTLGLNGLEIKWLQENKNTNEKADEIVGLYNLIVASPQDKAARGLFDAAVESWRKSDQYLTKDGEVVKQNV